jgi:tripartite motif-containing protein 71
MRAITPAFLAIAFLLIHALADAAPIVIGSWGSYGSDSGQFANPYGIAASQSGAVFITDQNNYRVQKFTSSGGFLTSWGSYGTAAGQFHLTIGIDVAPDGNVYVADYFNSRLQVFTEDGAFLRMWGSSGSGAGQFHGPRDIAIDGAGLVHVVDSGNGRVQVFTPNGSFLYAWGTGLLVTPTSLAFDAAGSAYVAEDAHSFNRVSKWNAQHERIGVWGGITGSAPGQFFGPAGVDVDASGRVFVADFHNDRVQVFTDQGVLLEQWGGASGAGGVHFDGPADVAVDETGSVYVLELHGNQVQRLRLDGPTSAIRTSWSALKARYR